MTDVAWREVGGTGPALVLVHGFTGSSDDFTGVAGSLTGLRRVLLVDLPGHGDAPRRPSYSIELLTDVVTRFLLEVVGEPVDLLGHSLGGRAVLPIAARNPAAVRSLILMDTWADEVDRGERGRRLAEALTRSDDEAYAAFLAADDDPGPEDALTAARWGREWTDRRVARNMARLDRTAAVQLGRQVLVGAPSVLAEAQSISCPTTVLRGALDEPYGAPAARMMEAITGARQMVIEGAYHSPQLTHPEAWLEAIRKHLSWVDGCSA